MSFLKWLVLTCVMIVGLFFSFREGLVKHIYDSDTSKICLVCLITFFVTNIYLGYKSLRKQKTEFGWFISGQLLNLGLLGTVIGFVKMLSGFGSLNIQETTSVQKMLVSMGSGMSVALYTTVVGLVLSILLKIQCYIQDSTNES